MHSIKEQTDWAWQHQTDDPHRLALSGKFPKGTITPIWVAQVSALQKVKHKIPAWYQPGLYFPLAVSLEQASSEATAAFKASLFSGISFADLTGGLGVDSFFFSKSFQEVVYVERNPILCEAAQHNFEVLGVHNVSFISADAIAFLQTTDRHFDLVFIDPARRDDRQGRVFLLEDCTPDILKIKDLIFEKTARILLKAAPMLDIKLALQQLGCVSRIWVMESEGDCREVLFLLEKEYARPTEEVVISAVSLRKSEAHARSFDFTFAEEANSQVTYALPRQYLYEPAPAVLKAGAFRSFAVRYGLSKLAVNTHLYTSDTLVEGLPARSFRIEAICQYDRKSVQALLPDGKANVSVRNFPDSAEQVQKKLRLTNGGDYYIFAATVEGNRKILLICRLCR